MHGLIYADGLCPWCGEPLELTVDSADEDCQYLEDCQVCCSPILVTVRYELGARETPEVTLTRDNE